MWFPFAARFAPLGLLGLLLLGCSSPTASERKPSSGTLRPPSVASAAQPAPITLAQALRELEGARFARAESLLQQIIARNGSDRARAELALAELWSNTGRRDQALLVASSRCEPTSPDYALACEIAAGVLAQQGELDRAIELIRPHANREPNRALRLQLADLLSEQGHTQEARALYRQLLVDSREKRVDKGDSRALALSARAAHRLGAFRDANELYDQAEQNGFSDPKTLIWRGELYLDAHDPAHASEMADEALRYAPAHPAALLLDAKVRLHQSRGSAHAAEEARQVLTLDPTRADAYYILAGLALRDLDYRTTHENLERGLRASPGDLGLLSLRAAAYFLADEDAAFRETVSQVLAKNPDDSRLFRVVAEYAEAEHRYRDIIPLLRRAIALSPNDAQVRAQLGIVLVRSGQETEGRRELLRAFAQDPFDLRVRNTLLLFEHELDHRYTIVPYPGFDLRVPRVLERSLTTVVVPWIEAAQAELSRRYRSTDRTRLLVEIYDDQDSFGVRTSGSPTNALEGVCFGDTVVLRLPTDEPVNLGMTLWHELSHVYHLRLSQHRVPRWFTEGLAEFETHRHRAEWTRDRELELYRASRTGRVPSVKDMNRSFSQAENLRDLSLAYVTSAYLVEYLIDTFGFDKIRTLLKAWGSNSHANDVIKEVLRTDVTTVDNGFRSSLIARFRDLDGQYFPPTVPESLGHAEAELAHHPEDSTLLLTLAHAQLVTGKLAECEGTLRQAGLLPNHPDRLWIESLLHLAQANAAEALRVLDELIATGNDGYFVRLQRALLLEQLGRTDEERSELELSHRYYPKAKDPLSRLVAIAHESQRDREELGLVEQLCALEPSGLGPHDRHVELHLALGQGKLAWQAAEALAFVAPIDSRTHELLARAALANGMRERAARELGLARELAPSDAEQNRLDQWPNTTAPAPRTDR